ncbi:mannosyl-oligosaccharide alpha-1,2-mannosidase [Fusarium oxysporum f. sp. pisi HDV247]|uniref:alpha-1,2-Mannosidase n=1 Tax=Fusarium oxysporum f. sp. pisi HDV247 TaxID=1080344 RepID=W9NAV6_FUSOX|nr:mannosyl-oligosaccharide alpha-1,2-mannosidase [Fusarium oxysporum f. sp. pisi HDV247]
MRFHQLSFLPLLGSIFASSAHPSPGGDKDPLGRYRYQANPKRASAIKEAFQFSWNNYYEYAFPHDSLRPLDRSGEDDRNGWGATPVDSLSTAILMGDKKTVNQILEFIPTINFTRTAKENEEISVFESTIRYLGGLLSGHDLLTGPFKHLVSDTSKLNALVGQAVSLADGLKVAFDTPSGVPDGLVVFSPKVRRGGYDRNSIAGFGTLVLEWTHLSDLTRNEEYARLTQAAEDFLLYPLPRSSEPFPGLRCVGHQVSVEDGRFLDNYGGWGGGTDSFYEYLIKMYVYDPETFGEYKDRWIAAADSTMQHLASHPSTRPDLTFLSGYSGTQTYPNSGHLACFAGGNFILGGITLGEHKYTDFGLKLAESCYQTYHQTPSGIGPEGFHWVDGALPNGTSVNPLPLPSQAAFYAKSGFWVSSPTYILRPETLESVYYAYRASGDSKWQDMAWEAFEALNRTCRVENGFAGITNVMTETGGGHYANMESFWLAETLKYLYLIFAEDAEWQVQSEGGNEFVFNTEAHPLRVRG